MADEENYDEIEKKAEAERRAPSKKSMRKWIDESINVGNRENAIKAFNRKNSSTTQSSSVIEDRNKSKKKSKNINNSDVESITSSMEVPVSVTMGRVLWLGKQSRINRR